jgi:N-methylhydantoinase A
VAEVAQALDRGLPETSRAILHVAGETMITAIMDVTVAEGLDPRDCTLVAGGGAAGLNIVSIARELGCARVLIPKTASALSACGMQFADIVFERGMGAFTNSAAFDRDRVRRALRSVTADLRGVEGALKTSGEHGRIELFVEARYEGQVWQLDVPVPRADLDADDVEALVRDFHAIHERVFAVRDERSDLEFLTWNARLTVPLPKRQRAAQFCAPFRPTPREVRPAFFEEVGMVDTSFHDGGALPPGARIDGPAIVSEPTTTIVIPPGASARVSAHDTYVVRTRVGR